MTCFRFRETQRLETLVEVCRCCRGIIMVPLISLAIIGVNGSFGAFVVLGVPKRKLHVHER